MSKLFVDVKRALEQAKAAARGKDVRISGLSLFDHLAPGDLKAEQVEVIPSRLATHITYRIAR